MKLTLRRAGLNVVKALLFAGALLYLADYFGWSLFTEAGGFPSISTALNSRKDPSSPVP